MRPEILAAVVLLGFAGDQRGTLSAIELSAKTVQAGTPVAITVRGTNPCGAVQLIANDGTEAVTHPITQLPTTLSYTYQRAGTYELRAVGMGNCDGQALAVVTVTAPPAAAPPAQPAPRPAEPAMRFAEMDRDGDGVIVRSEWRGSDRSFREHDWNNDGVLSGDEVRTHRSDERPPRNDNRDEYDRWPEGPGQAVTVDGARQWTDTGLTVRAGDTLTIVASGRVQLSPTRNDEAGPAGSLTGRQAPGAAFPNRPAGALIARIGNAAPIFIGDRATIVSAPASGRLLLGLNDDYTGDNRGEYRVRVRVDARR